ncbi:hypothetical protein BGZ99_002230 [Dissophora globulifera]|uniref:Arrestin C-terminal-like domain-containing protein n=1 Tax=Dissophora globulifera TaxID=979702 RepID=A0A9P6RSN8_9FUNG|nr:hypothetical protein BGZ99_002230 [Dissophora globulifera]
MDDQEISIQQQRRLSRQSPVANGEASDANNIAHSRPAPSPYLLREVAYSQERQYGMQQEQQHPLSIYHSPQRRLSTHSQSPQQQQQRESLYPGLQHFTLQSPVPAYRGFSPQGSSTVGYGVWPNQAPASGAGVVRSGSMYVPLAQSPAGVRLQQSQPRPLYSRDVEHNHNEQQQQHEYERYEQQSHYYRDAHAPAYQTPSRAETYSLPAYPNMYDPVMLGQSSPNIRYQHMQQLQPQRTLNIPQSRFPITRDQLPTAHSVISARQPSPASLETSAIHSQPVVARGSSAVSMEETPFDEETSDSSALTSNGYIPRHPDRSSVYSEYMLAPSQVADRIERPKSAMQEPRARTMISSLEAGHSESNSASRALVRSSSDPYWSSTSHPLSTQAKTTAVQTRSYSRQVTLSNIPPNEEVPPVPGKMTSKTGKVRIQLTFDKPFFNAGGELSGRLEIQCSSSRSVMLADMVIELLGYEALTKDHLAPKVFHKTVLRLQDIRHPSQAVQENVDPDAEGYWVARNGRTIFPFRLNIQDTLPNCYESKLGQVRYVVSAIALMKAHQHKEIVNHSREVFIYETWTTDDIAQARKKSVKADTSKRLFMGGEGSLEMYAELTRAMVSSGGIVYVKIGVKNLTKKKIMGIKLSLWRHLTALSSRPNSRNQPSGIRDQDSLKSYSEVIYKGEDYAFDNDDPRVVVLPVYIPSGVYSLRHTSYLHVQFFVQASLMVSMSKALNVELPVYIAHPSSWSDSPPRIPRDFVFPMHKDVLVKKNKPGVFSMKKGSTHAVHSDDKRSSTANESTGSTFTSTTMLSAKTGSSNSLEVISSKGSASRSATHRSPLKDPDSPTSVMEFSQAGSLFVVNPDASRSAIDTEVRSVKESHSPISPRVLQQSTRTLSWGSSPLDGATRHSSEIYLAQKDTRQQRTHEEDLTSAEIDQDQDFDMSRSSSGSQPGSTKKGGDKSKLGKMGLRKTLAKLSISIPSHASSGSSVNKTLGSRPSTPQSGRSPDIESPEELTSAGSRSSGDARSSPGSFKHMFDSHPGSRQSSIGSTRVVNMSPGPMSPNLGVLKTSESMPVSPALSLSTAASLSERSSPTSLSRTFGAEIQETLTERHRDDTRPRGATSSPDKPLHHADSALEGSVLATLFRSESPAGQSNTPSPRAMFDDFSAITPEQSVEEYMLNRFSRPDIHEPFETAQGIRDRYYLSKPSQTDGMSLESRLGLCSSPVQETEQPVAYSDLEASNYLYDIPAQLHRSAGDQSWDSIQQTGTAGSPQGYHTPLHSQNNTTVDPNLVHYSPSGDTAQRPATPLSSAGMFLLDRLQLTPDDNNASQRQLAVDKTEWAIEWQDAVTEREVASAFYEDDFHSSQEPRHLGLTSTQQQHHQHQYQHTAMLRNGLEIGYDGRAHLLETGPTAQGVSTSVMADLTTSSQRGLSTPPLTTLYPIPHRPWTHQSSPLHVGGADSIVNRIEVVAPPFSQENPYTSSRDEDRSQGSFIIAKDAMTGTSMRTAEAAEGGSKYPKDEEAERTRHGSQVLQVPSGHPPSRAASDSPSEARPNSAYRTSPLAFEGNMMTATATASPPLHPAAVKISHKQKSRSDT